VVGSHHPLGKKIVAFLSALAEDERARNPRLVHVTSGLPPGDPLLQFTSVATLIRRGHEPRGHRGFFQLSLLGTECFDDHDGR
jgi:hypothetical protein